MTSRPLTAAPPSPSVDAGTDRRFLTWAAGLGLVRRDGWVGGVCAGLAARWGVDPVIVRGVAVVATVIGLPAIVAYAAAWAVLPDAARRSHASDLENGRFSYAQAAILLTAIIGLLQALVLFVTIAAVVAGSNAGAAVAVLAVVVLAGGIVVAATVIALLVRAARRTPGTVDGELRRVTVASQTVPAASVDGSVADAGAGGAEVADAPATPAPSDVDGDADADDDADADATALAAWRAQHASWRERDRAWRREQDDAERAARALAREERRAAAAVFARAAAERRDLRRAQHPRTSLAFVAASAGVAVIAGTFAGLASPGELSVALGLFVAALVTALAMIVAGAARRRSGFLAFTTACLLVGGGGAIAVPVLLELHVGSYSISNVSSDATEPFRQTFGDVFVALVNSPDARPVTIEKGAGTTLITVEPGVELSLRASVGDEASFTLSQGDEWTLLTDDADARPDGAGRTAVVTTIPSAGSTVTRQVLTIDQDSGYIEIRILEPEDIDD
ncbi:PspC domain-containing protein [Microbacterium sp. cf332]|uniref:PspC domain-containing protein n=1 Tax=Microbacterium sp. cf332 TaxID=1761804 RepID=UPI000890FF79|nr:PspC domain-containing protein [Microbacterium sp. cf332]SDQ75814.1 phage shock protein C (PspC) family protein [Microbacterium sp. cf332]